MEFYSRDTTDRWIEIREDLYKRLQDNKEYIEKAKKLKKNVFDDSDRLELTVEISTILGEVQFLKRILDKIERS